MSQRRPSGTRGWRLLEAGGKQVPSAGRGEVGTGDLEIADEGEATEVVKPHEKRVSSGKGGLEDGLPGTPPF